MEVQDGRVHAVRAARSGDGPALDGCLVPGLVNAHTHLELADLVGRVSGGEGFLAWVANLMTQGRGRAAGPEVARDMAERGTAWVWDVSNSGVSAPWIRDAGMGGVVHHERLGFEDEARAIAGAESFDEPSVGPVGQRPSPHALFSTAPGLVAALVRSGPPGLRATLHLGEAEDEAEFVAQGTGPHAELLDRLGRDWRWWKPSGQRPVELLDALGVLGPELLLVHAVHLSATDRALVAERGAPVCLCPRSNLHIGGILPDVLAWLETGVSLALGTDSLASCPDTDVLGEAACLARHFPDGPHERWLALATHRGAAAVSAPAGVGRLERGSGGGVLLLEGADAVARLAEQVPARRWLQRPVW